MFDMYDCVSDVVTRCVSLFLSSYGEHTVCCCSFSERMSFVEIGKHEQGGLAMCLPLGYVAILVSLADSDWCIWIM